MDAVRTPTLEAQETPCPACGAPISTASIGRRRRVQCPKCREVVDLKSTENGTLKFAAFTSTPVENPGSLAAKIAALEARIAQLEGAAKAVSLLQPLEIVVPRPERKWKWLAPSPAHNAEKLPTNIAEVFLQNLTNYDGHTIAIQLASAAPSALARAITLKEIFNRAMWTVSGPGEVIPRNAEKGIFLAVGSLPLQPAAAAAYFAMTTSGFTIQSFLDAKLGSEETVLIVA